jgi:uncharacterized protein (DUF4415 family)
MTKPKEGELSPGRKRRPGGGRPRKGDLPKRKLSITLDADLVEWLEAQDNSAGANVSERINNRLRRDYNAALIV